MSGCSGGVSSQPAAGMQQMDLTKLSLQQLAQLKQHVFQELTILQDSLQTLKIAQTKFVDSGECVEKITPDTKGKEILVPLTGSIYVPGFIADTENVIIDIGTGYYIQKDVVGAKDYFKRKVEFVTEHMEKIQSMGIEKTKIKDAICEVIEEKTSQSAKVNT
ncbi:prefoldin 5 [Arctopsyche grandis]|uniref:prefoldin 5 n=1 Tax=Arctopsyche grandis TaxID=121162 RepID=UPI00406D6BF5